MDEIGRVISDAPDNESGLSGGQDRTVCKAPVTVESREERHVNNEGMC